jgi:ribosome-associated heat shock protein Hsp15
VDSGALADQDWCGGSVAKNRDLEEDDDGDDLTKVRMDKWLWAARFFKTRRLALEACDAGHVKVGDQVVKPGRTVRVGEAYRVVKEGLAFDIVVMALSARRGPASEAVKLYTETEDGKRAREAAIAERRAAALAGPMPKGRPTKRNRRALIHYFARGRSE